MTTAKKINLSQYVCVFASGYALIVGLLTLLGYILDVRRLTDWIDGGISMFPNAAVSAVLSGTALLLCAADRDRASWRIAVRMIASMVGLVGGLTLLEHLTGMNLGIDTLLFQRSWGQRAAMAPMRMGPPASISYLIIGAGLLLATYGASARRAASVLAIVIVGIASLSLVGYWFGADHLFGMARFTAIAFQTSSALAAIGIGLVALVPESGLGGILQRDDPGGEIVRRLMLPIIAIPLGLGWLRVQGQELGYFDTAFGTSLLALSMILMLFALLWWTAAGVSRQAKRTHSAEKDVRESEARYRSLFEVAVYGVLTIDERGIIESANPAAEQLFGYLSSEMIGHNISMLMPEPYKTEHDSYLQNYMNTGIRKIIGIGREVVGRRKDGTTFPMDLAVSEFQLDGKRHFTGLVQDISERKKAEQALRELADGLNHSNKELEQFAYVASHDLQEPLRTITNYVDLFQYRQKEKLDPAASEYLGFIQDGALYAQELIQGLLGYASITNKEYPFENCDMEKVLQQALSTLTVLIEENNAKVTYDVLPILKGNCFQLTQLFQNLISNAIRYRSQQPPHIHISAEQRNEKWNFSIKDNGIGIAPEHKDRVFMIFKRLHSRAEYPGTGIGLAVCKKIVQQHGGEIWVESEPGKGSTFYFSIDEKKGGGVKDGTLHEE